MSKTNSTQYDEEAKRAERIALKVIRKLRNTKKTWKRLSILWNLAYVDLRYLEDLRPAGGFKELKDK